MWPGRLSGAWPVDLPGMTLWLRSDLGLWVAGGSVSKWADQSGSRCDAVNLSGAQPTFPGPSINGQPTLVFLHAATSTLAVNSVLVRPTAGITLMAVIQEQTANSGFLCCQSDQTLTDGYGMKCANTGSVVLADWYVGNIAVAKVGTNSMVAGTNHIYVGTWDINTGLMSFYNNGILIGTASFAGPISYSGNAPTLQIDSKNFSTSNNPTGNASVNIAEVGLWPRCLTAGELALLHSRQNIRYRLF